MVSLDDGATGAGLIPYKIYGDDKKPMMELAGVAYVIQSLDSPVHRLTLSSDGHPDIVLEATLENKW